MLSDKAHCPRSQAKALPRAMSNETTRRKQFLFVDDDASFLEGIRDLFNTMSGGSWQIFTAENHAQGLALLAKQRVDVASSSSNYWAAHIPASRS